MRRLRAIRGQFQPVYETGEHHQQRPEPHSMRHEKRAGAVDSLRRQPVVAIGQLQGRWLESKRRLRMATIMKGQPESET